MGGREGRKEGGNGREGQNLSPVLCPCVTDEETETSNLATALQLTDLQQFTIAVLCCARNSLKLSQCVWLLRRAFGCFNILIISEFLIYLSYLSL